MTPGRLSKSLMRYVSISWREQPSQSDIDALETNIDRVGLVVRVRWAIVFALTAFSAVSVSVYAVAGLRGLWQQLLIPAAALVLVLFYNTYYQMNYRRFGNIAVFNLVQLLLDIGIVTLLIYYSGGVYTWFNSMYLLFVLEAALILPSSRQVWAIALAAIAAYASLLALVYLGVLPHQAMPLVGNDLQANASYVIVRVVWEVTILAGAASVATLLMGQVRERDAKLAEGSVYDARTGLFNRTYFRRELGVDIERARRFGRGVSVVLVDIDDLDRLNAIFGFEAGNSMIKRVADTMRSAIASDPSDLDGLAPVARYGGEEFAVFMPERVAGESRLGEAIAERIRSAVGDLRDEDRSVTVSVGVATYPTQGHTAAELIGAADGALSSAYAAGGNRVVVGRLGSSGSGES